MQSVCAASLFLPQTWYNTSSATQTTRARPAHLPMRRCSCAGRPSIAPRRRTRRRTPIRSATAGVSGLYDEHPPDAHLTVLHAVAQAQCCLPFSGISSYVQPSSSRPVRSLRTPPHCLKKNGTWARRHCSRIERTHSACIGRAPGPDSPPTIT